MRDIPGINSVLAILRKKSTRRLITYALIGTSGALITLFLTWFGVRLHLYYLLSAAFAIQVSIIWGFLLHDRVTFKDRVINYDFRKVVIRFLKYDISSLGGQAINISTLFILTTAGLFYLHSEMIAILVAFAFNYTLSRKWVWKEI